MSDKAAYRLEFYGRVQQVGFRYFCWETATRCGIYGTVRNRLDGSVEVVCEGSEENIDKFIKTCIKGNSWSQVDKVDKNTLELNNYTSFKIIH